MMTIAAKIELLSPSHWDPNITTLPLTYRNTRPITMTEACPSSAPIESCATLVWPQGAVDLVVRQQMLPMNHRKMEHLL